MVEFMTGFAEACNVMDEAARTIREQRRALELLTTALLFIRSRVEVPGDYQSLVWDIANTALKGAGVE